MSIFARIGKASFSGSGIPFSAGHHRGRIKNMFFKDGEGDKKTIWFIAEFDVIGTDEVRSWVVDCMQASGGGDVKRFLTALAQSHDPTFNPTTKSDAEWAAHTERLVPYNSPAISPAAGLLVDLEVFVQPQKKDRTKMFSKHVWSPVAGQDAARVAFGASSSPAPAPSAPLPPSVPAPAPAARPPVNPEVAAQVAAWRGAGNSDDAIRAGLGGWAAQFGAGALEAALVK